MSLKILVHMLVNADRIAPWKVEDFNKLGISASSLYRHIKSLRQANLIIRVSGGFVLSPLILNAGTKQKSAFMRVDIIKNQECIHGKA
jgi:predicted transcriptional regulator